MGTGLAVNSKNVSLENSPKAWTEALEMRLLSPLFAVTQVTELVVIVRWKTPYTRTADQYPAHIAETLIRIDDFELPEQLYQLYPAADMRNWIIEKLGFLQNGCNIKRNLE